jgi:hypothetical protein
MIEKVIRRRVKPDFEPDEAAAINDFQLQSIKK